MSLNQAIKKPVTQTLTDGNDYTFQPIGLDILCEFSEHINRGLDRKIGTAVPLQELLEHAMTLAGMRWLLWRSLRQEHPKIKLETLGSLIGNLADLTALFEAVMDIGELGSGESDPQPAALEAAT